MFFWNVDFILKESFETRWVKIRRLYINTHTQSIRRSRVLQGGVLTGTLHRWFLAPLSRLASGEFSLNIAPSWLFIKGYLKI